MHILATVVALMSATSGGAPETNYLTLGSGAVVVEASLLAERAAIVAVDGSDQTRPIGIPRRQPLPLRFVVELPAPTTFQRFELPQFTEFGSHKGRHIKTVRIEGSDSSATQGFSPLVELVLLEGLKDAQRFAVPKPRPVRWLRVSLIDTHGPPKRDVDSHHFTELEGYGSQEPIANANTRFTGRWRYRRTGLNDEPGRNIIDLVQSGAEIAGCQRLGGDLSKITGSVVDGLARLISKDTQGNRVPLTATLTAARELSGVSFAGPARPFYAAPSPDAEAPCPQPPPSNPVTEALTAGETAVIYGIRFDTDSDRIRPDALPALEQLLAALEAVKKASVTIEGHTDSQGTTAHNQDLSQRRAKSVVAWLVQRGIAVARLLPVGKGETKPIADNDTSSGRALNRRVEVVPSAAGGSP